MYVCMCVCVGVWCVCVADEASTETLSDFVLALFPGLPHFQFFDLRSV